MAKKDISERSLIACGDVFADIFNVLLFHGERVIQAAELKDAQSRTPIIFNGDLHDQERDVSKFWVPKRVRLALYGVENQTDIYWDMVPKVFGYEGADYKAQENQHIYARRKKLVPMAPYPVITAVLSYSLTPWTAPLTMREYLNGHVDPRLEPYIQDYKIHVFPIAFLSPETVAQFTSDFRIVADYFTQLRTNGTYTPSPQVIQHVYETLNLMNALTGDRRFLNRQIQAEIRKKRRRITMCEVLDSVEARGFENGRLLGFDSGQKIGFHNGQKIGFDSGQKVGFDNGQKVGFHNGHIMASREIYTKLVYEGMLSPDFAAKEIGMSSQEFLRTMQERYPNYPG